LFDVTKKLVILLKSDKKAKVHSISHNLAAPLLFFLHGSLSSSTLLLLLSFSSSIELFESEVSDNNFYNLLFCFFDSFLEDHPMFVVANKVKILHVRMEESCHQQLGCCTI